MTLSPSLAGWTAVTGAVVGIAITPFMASVWAFGPLVVWENTPPLTRLVGPTLESWGALSFGGEGTPYEVYGKTFVVVYILMLPIVRYVHGLQTDSPWSEREARIWRVLWIALVTAAIGDGVSYWGVSVPGLVGEVLWRGGFLVESLAMLVVLGSTTLYGITSMRVGSIPVWASVLLIGIIPLGLVSIFAITDYLPNAVVVPMSIVWAMIGFWVLISRVQSAALASRPSA